MSLKSNKGKHDIKQAIGDFERLVGLLKSGAWNELDEPIKIEAYKEMESSIQKLYFFVEQVFDSKNSPAS